MIYTLEEDKNMGSGLTLCRDGKQVPCHKITPVFAGADNFNRPQFIRFPCSLNCIRAKVRETLQSDKKIYVQLCEAQPFEVELSEVAEVIPDKPKSNIIQM